ncbi:MULTISPECIES: DUF3915 family protein [Bacillus]|uniref:DUF3915 family protein n=1 Tax=Bacillus bingmayongensis TaxID=1150157 RepID=A0ABU5JV85_9BACI|nr:MULTISPECIES: DUF3915 family protein [Bacillus]MBO1578935.1 DUF3915 family protein [Bacillus sp. XF8]MBY0596884.1 DUF3915 domain-containing protein [Bacillus bingmayongensis]MDZ5607334.1 DUF3915 family protein [Bacillus pseudomycoides]
MFGSFGCRDDFRGCHFDNDCKKDDFRKDDFHKDDRKKSSLCNVLINISIGTRISLLKVKHCGTFRDVVFEGFSCGVALFSQFEEADAEELDGEEVNTFRGLLRVCPEDIIAIAV